MHIRTSLFVIMVVTACMSVMSDTHAGQETQPLASISVAARDFAINHATQAGFDEVTAKARRLDNRLKLPLCQRPLETFSSQPQRILGKITVGVRCPAEKKPWTLYVSVTITAKKSIPVLATSLPRGAIIKAEDLRLITQTVGQTHQQLILDEDLIIGKQLKRALTEGATLSHYMLASPKIIRRGQQVTLISSAGALQVKMSGKAMGNAAAGDRLSVKSLSSGNVVEGIVNKDGTVSVN